MSDYFEDFPEENPANWDPNGNYNPYWRAEAERQRIAFQKLDQSLRRIHPPAPRSDQPPDRSKD
jgi:hypothetical protein